MAACRTVTRLSEVGEEDDLYVHSATQISVVRPPPQAALRLQTMKSARFPPRPEVHVTTDHIVVEDYECVPSSRTTPIPTATRPSAFVPVPHSYVAYANIVCVGPALSRRTLRTASRQSSRTTSRRRSAGTTPSKRRHRPHPQRRPVEDTDTPRPSRNARPSISATLIIPRRRARSPVGNTPPRLPARLPSRPLPPSRVPCRFLLLYHLAPSRKVCI